MTHRYCVWLALLLYLTVAECAVTLEQMQKSSELVRSVCQPKMNIPDELADGIKQGNFPNDKTLKCYVHCVLELSGIMKKNKLNFEAAVKQMEKLLPQDLLDENKRAITGCKDVANGIKDACEAGYTIVQCMYKDNKKFLFP